VSQERWRQIEGLFHHARGLALDNRAAFLDQACRGDADLRREVERLLVAASPRGNIVNFNAADLVPESTVTQLAVGARLGPYQIEKLLGAGGMGEVFRALDTRLGRHVAIKVSTTPFTDRFEREARAIAALNHPHICTLHDVGPNYLVMELVEGETLAARLKRGKLSIEQTVQYGAQIADALAEAHAKGITHRDLKPGNIMLTKSGIKVLDFGLAKSAWDETLTAANAVMGTPAYMAPEQREGKNCNALMDIYSLGLVLYEMATSKRVPSDASPQLDSLPEKFGHVVERCIKPNPEERWQTARDVRSELEWAAKPAAATSKEDALETRSAGQGLVQRVVPWTVMGALIVIALFLAATLWRTTRGVSGPLLQFSADLGKDAIAGVRTTAVISADGTRMVFPSRGSDGQQRLSVRQLDQPKATVLQGTEDAADPFFSPDGQWIGFFANGKSERSLSKAVRPSRCARLQTCAVPVGARTVTSLHL